MFPSLAFEPQSVDRWNPYHEFYQNDFQPRGHYQALWEQIQRAGQNALASKAREAHLALHAEGVTFTVYSDRDQGIERVWPFDVIPRIITAAEWAPIEAGLKQRVRALSLFLKDLYHGQRVILSRISAGEGKGEGSRKSDEISIASFAPSPRPSPTEIVGEGEHAFKTEKIDTLGGRGIRIVASRTDFRR